MSLQEKGSSWILLGGAYIGVIFQILYSAVCVPQKCFGVESCAKLCEVSILLDDFFF